MKKPLSWMVALVALCFWSVPVSGGDGWIVGADNDRERFERIESYLGGFSAAMWETGYRYERVREAIEDESYELAAYHWDKIRSAIRNGYKKRPARQPNADAIFLDSAWPTLDEALKSGNSERIQNALSGARAACMACHEAEGVGFMNDMWMFR